MRFVDNSASSPVGLPWAKIEFDRSQSARLWRVSRFETILKEISEVHGSCVKLRSGAFCVAGITDRAVNESQGAYLDEPQYGF